MGKKILQSRLVDTSHQLKRLQVDYQVAEEQLVFLNHEAEDARIRSLVSETPIADKEYREAQKHAESMRRHLRELPGRRRHPAPGQTIIVHVSKANVVSN